MVDGYLFDTNVISALYNPGHENHSPFWDRFRLLPGDAPFFVSSISLGEFSFGRCWVLKEHPELGRPFDQFVGKHFPKALDVSRHTKECYGTIRAALFRRFSPMHKKGRAKYPEHLIDGVTSHSLGIQENDIWLAAQAVERRLVFVTNDGKMLNRMREIADSDGEFKGQEWCSASDSSRTDE